MKSTKYTVIQAALIFGILLLSVLIYRSIVRPEKFNNIYEARKKEVIAKLENIRTLQSFYKAEKGSYAPDFDALKDFYNNGKVTVIVKEGSVPDTLTEAEAIRLKIVRRDTIHVDAKDEISRVLPAMDINRINIVPYSKGESFDMEADTMRRGSILVHVYQVTAYRHQYLKDFDHDPRVTGAFMGRFFFSGLQRQYLGSNFNFRDNVKDLILGSLTEASTDGNWQ